MKLSIFALAAVIALALMLYVREPIRVQNYLIPSKLQPSWVTIEYENPMCPLLQKGWLGTDFIIPESGYLCTSSSVKAGFTYERYYLVGDQGKRVRLSINEQIFRRESVFVNQNSCKINADSFWYGPKDKITNEADSFIERYHPECRDSGIITKQVP